MNPEKTSQTIAKKIDFFSFPPVPKVSRPTGKIDLNLNLFEIFSVPKTKDLCLNSIEEPLLGDVVSVMMNNIGYVGPGEPKQWIETFGLGPCIGVQINSAEL